MTKDEIQFIKRLPDAELNGTIQSVLMREDINFVPYKDALEFLLTMTLKENTMLREQNVTLSKGYFNAQ